MAESNSNQCEVNGEGNGNMLKMHNVVYKPKRSQLAMLMLVEYEKDTAAAAAQRKAPPYVSPSTPTPSTVGYSLA